MAGHLLFVFLMSSFAEIQAQDLLPPKLRVNSPVITDTDSVTLSCEAPSSVSVSQCYFYTVSGGNVRVLPCMKRLTGTELLLMSHQSSPAEVEVKCYYTVKVRDLDFPSPHSDISSITIHSQAPQMSLQHIHGEHVHFVCSLPGSTNNDTRCNLYFGEESDPVVTTTIWKKRSSTNRWFCQFSVPIDDLLKRLCLVKQSDASCDYSLGSEPNSLSPRSDRYNLTDIVERKSSMTQRMPTFTVTTEKIILIIGAVVTVDAVLLGLALLFIQSRTENCLSNRPKANFTDDREYMGDYDETYSTVFYECNTAPQVAVRRWASIKATTLPGYSFCASVVTGVTSGS
ncbi:uncharacterized protein LOC127372542 isoform X26 [Dicentrarchus labrax]|uniref:uncharacterized protein LOC127372542 isoform X26 n=1 Tax=Dicentrarchus labrax TaxID=13489 RepID=UPI0021F674F4|nr:uncharacterized protein LOC127372542 isoform X26 [Dicentrarchus labrax]XP_051272385.1 uncharacterized protein LOC127372542 isoform X26 [Dicentrarchus labrax]